MNKIMFSERFGLEQAVLAGTKTMTRRIIPDIEIDWNRRRRVTLPVSGFEHGVLFMDVRSILHDAGICDYSAPAKYQPKYEVGEEVAIAQPYKNLIEQGYLCRESDGWVSEKYCTSPGYRNKMFVKAEYMPHRIRITGIKVERLQDITEQECICEGIKIKKGNRNGERPFGEFTFDGWDDYSFTACEAFAALIDRISGRGTWQSNPWVYAYTFELIK